MFLIDKIILLSGGLLIVGVISSKFSARFGVPVLVMFLIVGMLAGSEGIGRIEFENYTLAHGIGTLALAVILFDGGLSTPLPSIRAAWKPSLVLATLGVLITSLVTGFAASKILGLTLLQGMLLGGIIGSTDAAAVFAVLRSGGVRLPVRLAATLEIESGANDPMAIFLTIGLIEVLSGQMEAGAGLLWLLLTQMVVGALVGIALGFLAVWLVNRINLDTAGFYPVLVCACGLLIFGVTAALGGSGFLAVYLAGIVIGNSRIVFQRGVYLFLNALAWMAQIVMFVVLGLLSFPSRLWAVAGQGLLVSAILIVIARPLAVVLCLLPFRFSRRELVFLSWSGLKGAVPITLATFPFLYNLDVSHLFFNVVFFVVLVSAVVQGWTIPVAARRLGLELPPEPTPPVTLEISSLRHVDGDIVEYTVGPDSRASGRFVKDLALPDGAVIAIIAREHRIIPPQGNTRVQAGDHVILILSPGTKPLIDRVFGRGEGQPGELPHALEFPLRASTRVRELEAFYGIRLDAPGEATLDEAIRSRLAGATARPDHREVFGPIALYVRDLSDSGAIQRVGMVILPTEGSAGANVEARRSGGLSLPQAGG